MEEMVLLRQMKLAAAKGRPVCYNCRKNSAKATGTVAMGEAEAAAKRLENSHDRGHKRADLHWKMADWEKRKMGKEVVKLARVLQAYSCHWMSWWTSMKGQIRTAAVAVVAAIPN